ncbi:hypothetical protein B0H14DRAFT_2580910 [Mycena olivaceomarginata]|nr:hypothetical protein B0H14DRAFT_2580910 [Mycena olivaceomarginata]
MCEAYLGNNFKTMLKLLNCYLSRHALDIYFAPHVPEPTNMMLNWALVPYFQPLADKQRVDNQTKVLTLSYARTLHPIKYSLPARGFCNGKLRSQGRGMADDMFTGFSADAPRPRSMCSRGRDLFNVLPPGPLKEKLWSQDWVQRKTGMLARSTGCIEAIEPHLTTLLLYLINTLINSKPLVCSITCPMLSRDASWTTQPISEAHQARVLEDAELELTPCLSLVLQNLDIQRDPQIPA